MSLQFHALTRREFLRAAALALTACQGLALTGCAGGGLEAASAPPGPPPAPPSGSFAARAAAKLEPVAGSVTLSLNQGWNAVAFGAQQITSLIAPPEAAGIAFWDGSVYQLRNLTTATLAEGDGTRRGLWIFATAGCTVSYAGQNEAQGNFVNLKNGWNLVAFPGDAPVPGNRLTATQNGQSVPLGTVVLPQFSEIQPNNSYVQVNVTAGDELKPGRPYWVFALGAVRLSWPGGAVPVPTGIRGTVNLQEIGGAGLVVRCATSADAPVNTSGEFGVEALGSAVQLLVLQDAAGVLRGLTLATPGTPILARQDGVSAAADPQLKFDAQHTALSLVMTSIGLLTTSPTEALRTGQEVKALPSFLALVTKVAELGKGAGLVAQQFSSFLNQVVEDWSKIPRTITPLKVPDSARGLCSGEFGQRVEAGGRPVLLQNLGFRFVSVIQQFLDADNKQVGNPGHARAHLVDPAKLADLPIPGMLPGVAVATWGNLLTLQAGVTPGRGDVPAFSLPPGATKVRYWFRGPGLQPGDVFELTQSIQEGEFDSLAVDCSVILYVLFPLLDLIGGTLPPNVNMQVPLAMQWASILNGRVNRAQLDGAIASGNKASTAGSLVDFALSVATFSLGLGDLAQVLPAGALKALRLLSGVAAGMAFINLSLLVAQWANLPRVVSVTLEETQSKLTLLGKAADVPGGSLDFLAIGPAGHALFRKIRSEADAEVGIRHPDGREEVLVQGTRQAVIDEVQAHGLFNARGDLLFMSRAAPASPVSVWKLRSAAGSTATLTPPAGWSDLIPVALLDNGSVCGRYRSEEGHSRSFGGTDGVFTNLVDLGLPDGFAALGCNNLGHVIGNAPPASGKPVAFYFEVSNPPARSVGDFEAVAQGINDENSLLVKSRSTGQVTLLRDGQEQLVGVESASALGLGDRVLGTVGGATGVWHKGAFTTVSELVPAGSPSGPYEERTGWIPFPGKNLLVTRGVGATLEYFLLEVK